MLPVPLFVYKESKDPNTEELQFPEQLPSNQELNYFNHVDSEISKAPMSQTEYRETILTIFVIFFDEALPFYSTAVLGKHTTVSTSRGN